MNKEGFEIKFTMIITSITIFTMFFVYTGISTVARFV